MSAASWNRYKTHDFLLPEWYIQSKLFTRRAHYSWKPSMQLFPGYRIAFTPILPATASIQLLPHPDDIRQLSLDVTNIPPLPEEDFMLPLDSISYRVLFYFTRYGSEEEFWKKEGLIWSKDIDRFIGNSRAVNDYVKTLVAPGDSEDQKARKLYVAVSTFENTDFTRERTHAEEKSQKLKEIGSAEDVLKRKRGNSWQITDTYVAFARAAGLKAFVMGVADRDSRIFLKHYQSLRQFDDYIAIVTIDGKEVYFDPGERFCEPEHLIWQHTLVGGLRQSDAGAVIANTPGGSYKDSHVERIADLTLDEQGAATGTVSLTYAGDPALHWRQMALRSDRAEVDSALASVVQGLLPGGMEIHLISLKNLDDFDHPLAVTFEVRGQVGSAAGKRVVVPANLNSKPTFTAPKRELAIDLHYPHETQDAVRFRIPASLTVEQVPPPESATLEQAAQFKTFSTRRPGMVDSFRNVILGTTLFLATDYPQVQTFYSKLDSQDQGTLILTRVAPSSQARAKPAGN
jgi:hypothetical protein